VVATSDIDIILDDGANRVAIAQNVFVQVRNGEQTETALDLMMATFRARKQQGQQVYFALFVVEDGAPTATPAVRKRQTQVIGEVLASGRVHVAAVIEGDGIMADLKRIALRALADSRVGIHQNVPDAIRALGRIPGAPPASLLTAVVEAARDRTRGSRSRMRAP
jgi:hypothetical protein